MAKIRDARKKLNMTQHEFARALGVHQTAVSQWETGRTTPDVETLGKIAMLTGMSADKIMDWQVPARTEAGEQTLKMPDDGMRGARIGKGDTVYLNTEGPAPDGAIVAVDTGAGVLIRYLYRLPDALLLAPASPGYAHTRVPKDARILGRAVAFRSQLPMNEAQAQNDE